MRFLRQSCASWAALPALLLYAGLAEAGEWNFTPRISLAEIYSDNVNLEASNEDYDLVTEITPGFSLHGRGGRVEANIDYQMENTFFLRDSDNNGVFHQLDATGTAEVAKDFFFVDAASTMGQAIINANGTASTNNINNGENRTDFYTYSVSPYILPHFGNFADGNLRLTYGSVNYDEGADDAEQYQAEAGLTSGRFFGPLSWSGLYHYDELKQNQGSNDTFEGFDGEARYQVNNKFSLVAQGGYANNDYESSEDIENGSYLAGGFFWRPSRFYALEALTGNNLTTVTVSLYPTNRTALVVNYRDQGVGTNTGEVWSGTFQHSTRRTNWSASYEEETTTEQQQRLDNGVVFLPIDPNTGEVNPNPQPGDLTVNSPFGAITSLTNETVERKRFEGSVGMTTGKSGLLVTVFDEKRRYLSSLTEEETKGFTGSWDRRLAPRTNSTLTGSWQRITGDNSGDSDQDFWFVETRLSRQIRPKLTGSVLYRFTRQEADSNEEGYDENRVEARLTAFF